MDKFEDIFEAKIEITESKDDQVLATIKFPWGRADVENKNKRTYPFAIFKTAVEKLAEKIKRAYVPGQTDHPLMGGGTRLGDVSHILKNVWLKDKVAYAEADILKTSKGQDVLRVIKSGVSIGASLRGFGEVGSDGKVKKGLEIVSVDLVASPSFGDHARVGVDKIVIESTILDEAFFSLRDNLQTEIVKKFGKEFWVVDFSDKEVVFRKENTSGFKKISYTTKGDDLELTGEAVSVERKVQYESQELSVEEKKMAGIYSGRQMLKENKRGERTKEEGKLFIEAVVAGYLSTFEKWKEERDA